MKHLTNMYDPREPDAKKYVTRTFGQTHEEAWEELQRYLQGKVIGPPRATDAYTVEELEAMGTVGIYAPNVKEK